MQKQGECVMNDARMEGETYEDYQKRLKFWEKGVRWYTSHGTPIWTARQGQYIKTAHGPIGQQRRKK